MFKSLLSLLLAFTLGAGAPVLGASKVKIAAVGDSAPGSGLFAGPSFASWPSAAGDGWMAFRSRLEGGNTSEAIIAAHATAPVTRVQVARLGQKIDGAGTIREFLGRPSINTGGSVTFFATYRADDSTARVGIFQFDQNPSAGLDALRVVAKHGDETSDGALDLRRRVEPGVQPDDDDTPERTPALNDAGVIVFTAATQTGATAIFRFTPGVGLAAIVRAGDPFGNGALVAFGGPAINNAGTVAFRATASDASDPKGTEALLVFRGTTLTTKVTRGTHIDGPVGGPTLSLTLEQFGNALTINDGGDIGFTGGPLSTPPDPITPGACGAGGGAPEPSACVIHGSTIFLLAYPGQGLTLGRVTAVRLGSTGGSVVVPPVITNDGAALVFVSVSDGNVELIRRIQRAYAVSDAGQVLTIGGQTPDLAPTGGGYRAVASAVAVDAHGAAVFFARLAGGTTPEAVVYQPPTVGETPYIVPQGDPAPTSLSRLSPPVARS